LKLNRHFSTGGCSEHQAGAVSAPVAVRGIAESAVTLIQRFGGALNLNIHLHMLFLDGVYVERPDGVVRFRSVRASMT
jgi:hypothetical protein